MSQPLVSCVCPTFGKVKHLNEALQSFLLQDYENKEMIIFNNYPDVDFVFDHPLVKVINYKGEIHSVGEARNHAISYASGKYVIGWDDDDISLPQRISSQMKFIDGQIAVASEAFYSEYNNIYKNMGIYFNSVLMEKSFWESNPYKCSNAEDQIMYYEIKKTGKLIDLADNPQYIYRWCTGTYHVSGIGKPDISQRDRMMAIAKTEFQNLPKIITLIPEWERDYLQDIEDFKNK